jgi:hypothetical protein
MELIVVPLIVACIIWVVWRAWKKSQSSDKARLDEAWRVVLSDPKYMHRRRSEEFNREVEAQTHKVEECVRKLEGL